MSTVETFNRVWQVSACDTHRIDMEIEGSLAGPGPVGFSTCFEYL